jgi:hypothetical protein
MSTIRTFVSNPTRYGVEFIPYLLWSRGHTGCSSRISESEFFVAALARVILIIFQDHTFAVSTSTTAIDHYSYSTNNNNSDNHDHDMNNNNIINNNKRYK